MGLDRSKKKLLNRDMGIKLLLTQLGLGILTGNSSSRMTPMTKDRLAFEEDVRRQFQELKKKGLSIPIFTL